MDIRLHVASLFRAAILLSFFIVGSSWRRSDRHWQQSQPGGVIGTTGIRIRFLLTRDNPNGLMSVFEFSVPAGLKLPAPAHKNDEYEEVLYGIEGVLTWTVNDSPIPVGPGQALCMPRGAVHRFDNFGSEDVKQLCLISPLILGPEYFREAAAAIGDTAGPPDPATMAEIFRRHGMTVAAPPSAR